jgi:hypothetical protein
MLRFAALLTVSLSASLALGPVGLAIGEPGSTAQKGKPVPPPPLTGKTIDYPYDAKDVKDPSRAYTGRAFVPDRSLAEKGALPLVVFMHGLNKELLAHRWMGGGNEGDVRRIVADLVERGVIPPVILAGPGSVARDAVSNGSSFPVFDFDKFIDLTEGALKGTAQIDKKRIVVTGHSGAGCSGKGGIVSATSSKQRPFAVVSIDTCMGGGLAESLAGVGAETHVVVTWQTVSWDRNFKHFRAIFDKTVATHPAKSGVLRELDALPALPRAHDATVPQTYEKWLPRILGPGKPKP